jgi:hypothetical protein
MRVLDDYEPMNLERQAQYLAWLGEGRLERRRRQRSGGRLRLPTDPPGAARLASRRRLLDLAAVRFVLAPTDEARTPAFQTFAREAGLEPARSPDPELRLFTNPHALPRAFVTHRIAPAPPAQELLARLGRADFDPRVLSYVSGYAGPWPTGGSPRGSAATLVRDDPTRVEVDVDLAEPGLLVLADAWFPAWRASVDGEPAEVLPTNHLFRGVWLAAGKHRVRFDYGVRAPLVGAAGSGAALGLLAWLLRPARRRRVPPSRRWTAARLRASC